MSATRILGPFFFTDILRQVHWENSPTSLFVMTRGIFIHQGSTITPTANSSMATLRAVFGDRMLVSFVACWFLSTWCNLVTFCEEVCKTMHIKKGLQTATGMNCWKLLLSTSKNFLRLSYHLSSIF